MMRWSVPAGAASVSAVLLTLALAAPSTAQVAPMSVNDCTLLPDPGALRRCLDQAEGRVTVQPPPLAGPAAAEKPAQDSQIARPAAGIAPLQRAEPSFLDNKPSIPREAKPAKRNVIDLD